ncbi:MFS transporter [Sulfodiicoccus acidiphilus]|uniref:MFS transporter n=1 Tax=Sulfodiicoccus acidiphilus TaxID=1670455 RepID=UPI00131580B4|nr:MFS transporter [Sulfodiicoccus acidiphilus]
MELRRQATALFVTYFLAWSVVPIYGLFSTYLFSADGVPILEVGAFGTSYAASSTVGQYVLGRMSDATSSRKTVMLVALVGMSSSTLMDLLYRSTFTLAFSGISAAFFAGGFASTVLASSVELSGGAGSNISLVRIGGALGWIVGSLLIPYLLTTGGTPRTFLVLEVLLVGSVLFAWFSIRDSHVTSAPPVELRNGPIYLYAGLAGVITSSASWMLPPFVEASGGSIQFLGRVIALGAAAEVPSMLLAGRLYDRYKSGALLLFNGAILSVAVFLYGLLPLNLLPLAQVARGAGYGLFVVSVPAILAGRGGKRGEVAGAFLASYSAGSVVGGVVGGALSELFGARSFFLLVSSLLLASSVATWVRRRDR